MAFLRKAGSMLGRSATNHIGQNMAFPEPSIFQAVRWMSSSKLFIGGLSWSTDDSSLKEAFNKYGEVLDGRVIQDRETGRSRGFGFITYSSVEEASAAIQAMDQKIGRSGSGQTRTALAKLQSRNNSTRTDILRPTPTTAGGGISESSDFPLLNYMYHPAAPKLASTYISYSQLLSQLAQSKSVFQGLQIHAHLTKLGLAQDGKHKNLLINLYSKCKYFLHARQLIDESPEPDLVSWSSLVSGYAQNGLGHEALSSFCQMHLLGIKCNEFAFPSVLKACASTANFTLGKQVHGVVVVTGFESDVFVANTLVTMYAKCGNLVDSRRLFEGISERNVVSWNVLFSCYTQGDFFGEAVGLFHEMVASGIRPDEYSLSTILNAATGLGDIGQGKKVHGYLIKLGYEGDPFSLNAMVDMYAKAGGLRDAIAVFGDIPIPDIVSWNALIAGCVSREHHDKALELLDQMQRSGISPNMFTLSSALKACAALGVRELGKQFHAKLIKMELTVDPFVRVGLIDMYCKCRMMNDAETVYRLMPEKDLVAMNALISGHSQNGENTKALTLFLDMYSRSMEFDQATLLGVLNVIADLEAFTICKQIHALIVKSGYQADNFLLNSLVDAYGKCSQVHDASRIFEECPVVDLPSYTSMMTTYAQCGQGEEALKLYMKLLHTGLKPDSFVCSSLLNACANLSAYEQGKQIHVHVLKLGFMPDVFAGNSLVNMYAKCGSIQDAGHAFDEVIQRSVVSWSAMIGGLAQHGYGKDALNLFENMLKEGFTPNNVTLVSVLSACNHAGLVNEAQLYFDSMKEKFGIERTQEHYACMIDVLGRAGKLDKAMDLVSSMPFEANGAIWGALLGAAKIHKDVELGQRAAEILYTLEPEKSGTHVLLANIYASAGLWDDVANVRRLMKDSKVKKEPGMSWMEVKDDIYTFIVGDRSHPRSKEIYAKLEELGHSMAKAGYVPMLETDLHHVEKEEKEMLLSYHSEKLAVAFGLIVTPVGAPIRVKKNLRICLDCHTAFKYICKIESREIIIRDITRFHHFRDGSCSCGDYWEGFQVKNAMSCIRDSFEKSLNGSDTPNMVLSILPHQVPTAGKKTKEMESNTCLSRNSNDDDRRVGLIYDERMCKHYALDDEDHPECPGRIQTIWDRLNSTGLAKRCVILNAKDAEDKHLALVHTKSHINLIKNISSRNSNSQKKIAAKYNSIYFNEGSSEAAYLAAGSVIEVTEKVAKGELDSAFAIFRPPGHHAERNKPMGFCLYNNVAIATSYILNERSELGIKKILIVDWDVHHGNGTQKMFYKDPRVLFFSVHRFDPENFYPYGHEGSYIMTGKESGGGYNINVPWDSERCGDADYVAVWDHILVHVAKEFNPDLIMISAGFDAAVGDPLGGCRVSPYGFSVLLQKLLDFAGGKIVMALEGGYNLNSIANSAHACVEVLLQGKPIAGPLETFPFESTWRVIKEVRQELSTYWPSLSEKLPDNLTNRTSPIEISSSDSESDNENSSPLIESQITVDDVIHPLMNLKVNEDNLEQEATTTSHSWRSELSKSHVWYAAFGSNMRLSRFRCYIEGGQTEGMRRSCVGSVDKSMPKEIVWKTFPHRLFFGRERTDTWGPGGVAFVHPESSADEKTYMCLYKITLEQFNDVLLQENIRSSEMSRPFFDLTSLQTMQSEKCISVGTVERGWYHNVVYLGKENEIPILTITCTLSDVHNFTSGKFPINPPCKEYADTLIKGLVEGKQLSEEEASAYIQETSTKPLV